MKEEKIVKKNSTKIKKKIDLLEDIKYCNSFIHF